MLIGNTSFDFYYHDMKSMLSQGLKAMLGSDKLLIDTWTWKIQLHQSKDKIEVTNQPYSLAYEN